MKMYYTFLSDKQSNEPFAFIKRGRSRNVVSINMIDEEQKQDEDIGPNNIFQAENMDAPYQ